MIDDLNELFYYEYFLYVLFINNISSQIKNKIKLFTSTSKNKY